MSGLSRRLSGSVFSLAAVFGLFNPVSLFASSTFDFENQTPTYDPATMPRASGALTSLSLAQGGLTINISRMNNTPFDLVNDPHLSGLIPASWGKVSLDPFVNTTGGGFVIKFSQAIASFSIEYGDFNGDSDTASLQAFSGLDSSGSVLATSLDDYRLQSFPIFDTLSVSAAGIHSILLTGTSNGHGLPEHPEQSVYLDNIVVDFVSTPEPSSLLLVATAGALLLIYVRQKRLTLTQRSR